MSVNQNEDSIVRPRPLVCRSLWDFYCALKEALPSNARAHFPLFHTKFSVIFDPEGYSETQSNFIKREGVDLLIVTMPPNCEPIAAFDLTSGGLIEKGNFLKQHGIPFLEIDPAALLSVDRESTVYKAAACVTQSRKVPTSQRAPINSEQLNAVLAVSAHAEQEGLVCLHEVALDRIFDVPDNWVRDFCKKTQRSLSAMSYPRHTTVDAVLATSPPNASPLAAIEFDGEGKYRDDLRQPDKNQLKDAIFLDAGVPLIRIKITDLRYTHGKKLVSALEKDARKRFLSVLGKEVATTIRDSWWRIDRLHEFLLGKARTLRSKEPLVSADIEQYAYEIHEIAKKREGDRKQVSDDYAVLAEDYMQTSEVLAEQYEFENPGLATVGNWADAIRDLTNAQENPSRWPIPPGLRRKFELKRSAEDSVQLTLKFERDHILQLADGRKPPSFDSPTVHVRVIGNASQNARFRSIAISFLKSYLVEEQARPYFHERWNEYLADYDRAIALAAPKIKLNSR